MVKLEGEGSWEVQFGEKRVKKCYLEESGGVKKRLGKSWVRREDTNVLRRWLRVRAYEIKVRA